MTRTAAPRSNAVRGPPSRRLRSGAGSPRDRATIAAPISSNAASIPSSAGTGALTGSAACKNRSTRWRVHLALPTRASLSRGSLLHPGLVAIHYGSSTAKPARRPPREVPTGLLRGSAACYGCAGYRLRDAAGSRVRGRRPGGTVSRHGFVPMVHCADSVTRCPQRPSPPSPTGRPRLTSAAVDTGSRPKSSCPHSGRTSAGERERWGSNPRPPA